MIEKKIKILDRIKNLKLTSENKVRDILKETFAVLFETCPEVYSVFWSQCILNFNDAPAYDFQIYGPLWKLVSEKDDPEAVDGGSDFFTSEDLIAAQDSVKAGLLYNSDKVAYWRTMFSEEEVSAALEYRNVNPEVVPEVAPEFKINSSLMSESARRMLEAPQEIRKVLWATAGNVTYYQKRLKFIKKNIEEYDTNRRKIIQENISQMEEIIRSIPLDIMKNIYGTGVEVNITRVGTEIDEFEHD